MYNKFLIISKSTPDALPYIKETVNFLKKKGAEIYALKSRAKFFSGIDVTLLEEDELDKAEVALAFGGDGTILKTARYVIKYGTPILGINMGTLGYLADTEPKDVITALEKMLRGEFAIEKRCTLKIDVGGRTFTGINEAVVARGGLSHILTLSVKIDGQEIERLRADGMIVSTPTGSTAYNLSAGGPIIAPLSHSFVLTPICAHSLSARPIVVGDGSVITITVKNLRSGDVRPTLDIDGKNMAVLDEDMNIDMEIGGDKLLLIRTKPTSFYKALQQKLGAVEKI